MSVDVKNLVATENPGDSALGYLVWYSVSEVKITQEELQKLALNANLPEKYLPAPIRPVDAYRRATSEVQGVLRSSNEITESLMVREVCADKESVVRHIVKETADKQNKTLSYQEKCGTLVYDRESESLVAGDFTDPDAESAAERAKALFDIYRRYYTSDHVRRMIKSVLSECQALPLRPSGAVYFIPKKYEQEIQSLGDFVKNLPDEAVEFHKMPVVDMEEQRQMLEQKLRTYIEAEVARIRQSLGADPETLAAKQNLKDAVAHFAHVLQKDTVKKGAVEEAVKQFRALSVQVREYEELLEANLSEVRSTLDVLREQVRAILDRAEPYEQGELWNSDTEMRASA